MLIVLILLLMFTDLNCLESGQYIETAKFNQLNFLIQIGTYILFIYLLHFIMFVCLSIYAKEQQTSSIRKSYIGTNIFQKGLIWLVWGNSFIKQLFRTLYSVYTIHYKLYKMIIIFQENMIPNSFFKRVGGANSPLHRCKGGAPDPLHPPPWLLLFFRLLKEFSN